MKLLFLVLALFVCAPSTFAAQIFPPCEDTTPHPFLGKPLAPLEPVPIGGAFSCRGLTFDNFSDNILNGGLIGATFYNDRFGNITPGMGCCGAWPSDFIQLTVQPIDPELGFSFRVTGSSSAPLEFVQLPPTFDATSGNPTVTADISGIGLNRINGFGGTYAPVLRNTVTVVVEPITGGTISTFSMVFVTPEPSTGTLSLLGLGLLAIGTKRRPQKFSDSRITNS
jgi:hypothetical protein